MIGREGGRTVLAVAVDDWLMDELAALGAEKREKLAARVGAAGGGVED